MDIIGVYTETHAAIKSDPEILAALRKMFTKLGHYSEATYVRTGLKIMDDIFLGVDFNPKHVAKFDTILLNTLFVDSVSSHQADLSRVLSKIIFRGKHVANLTEDVSQNGKYLIEDRGIAYWPYEEYLKGHFKGDFPNDVQRAVFAVMEKPPYENQDRKNTRINRLPIIDLDHIALGPGYEYLSKPEKQKEYEQSPLFELKLQ